MPNKTSAHVLCQVAAVQIPQKNQVHHAFPNAVGTLSQRGRFHGWEKALQPLLTDLGISYLYLLLRVVAKDYEPLEACSNFRDDKRTITAAQIQVHDAAAEVLHRGLWKPNGDEDARSQKAADSPALKPRTAECCHCCCLLQLNAHERLDDRVFHVCRFWSGDPDAEDAEEALHDDEAGQMRCSVFASASIGLLSYAGSMVQKPLLYRASCKGPGLYSTPLCACPAAPFRPVEWAGPCRRHWPYLLTRLRSARAWQAAWTRDFAKAFAKLCCTT